MARLTAAERKECLIEMCVQTIDPSLLPLGFSRTSRGTTYKRASEACSSRIRLMQHAPRYSDDVSVSHIEGFCSVDHPDINATALELMSGDDSRTPRYTISTPIGLTGPDFSYKEWRPLSAADYINKGREIREFIFQYVLPFLEEYTEPRNIVKGCLRGDERLLGGESTALIGVAAAVTLGDLESARKIAEKYFRTRGAKERFASVFEYLAKHGGGS